MNPFLHRATEFIREESIFLALVSPEPLVRFLVQHKNNLLSKPVQIIGMPGCGKTMLATLVEYRLIKTLLNNQNRNYRKLTNALTKTGFISDGKPNIAAVRIPMESEYRDYWELPYDEDIKTKLVYRLLQARAVQSLIGSLTINEEQLEKNVKFITKDNSDVQIEKIGGSNINSVKQKAQKIESEIYSIGSSLIPIAKEKFSNSLIEPYDPFNCIHEIEVNWKGERIRLSPLVIFDDAHSLHPIQLQQLFSLLAKRELQIGRWMMMRHDSLEANEVLGSVGKSSNLKPERDFATILVQGENDTHVENKFSIIASDIADRYLSLVQTLSSRGQQIFKHLTSDEPKSISDSNVKKLMKSVSATQKKLNISMYVRKEIEKRVDKYLMKSYNNDDIYDDIKYKMIETLLYQNLNRYKGQSLLFSDLDDNLDFRLLTDSNLLDCVQLQLFYEYKRPYYFGFEDICNASNTNAELFIQLSGALVELMETKIIKGKPPVLDANEQQRILSKKSKEIIDGWTFPYANDVRRIVKMIALECKNKVKNEKLPLKVRANAIGLIESEFTKKIYEDNKLAEVLKYGKIYNAFKIRRNHKCDGKEWCLIELSGIVCLANNLTLKRTMFLKHHVSDITKCIDHD